MSKRTFTSNDLPVFVDTLIVSFTWRLPSLRSILKVYLPVNPKFEEKYTQRIGTVALLELKREDAHTSKVASVDSLEGLSDNSIHSLEVRTLGSPIP